MIISQVLKFWFRLIIDFCFSSSITLFFINFVPLFSIRSKSLAIGTYAMAQTLLEMEIEEEQMALRQKQATELAKMATADLKTKQALIGALTDLRN